MSYLDEVKPLFQKAIDHLEDELRPLRTGRATPALVENVSVEAYGTMQPVKALAAISAPDARTVEIAPWDGSVTKAIETAIQASGIGINPVVDGKIIRLNIPMMTEESRLKLVKVVNEKLEDTRVVTRRIREDMRKKIGAQTGISEDIIKKEQESLDKLAKEAVAKIDAIGAQKEIEIMKV